MMVGKESVALTGNNQEVDANNPKNGRDGDPWIGWWMLMMV